MGGWLKPATPSQLVDLRAIHDGAWHRRSACALVRAANCGFAARISMWPDSRRRHGDQLVRRSVGHGALGAAAAHLGKTVAEQEALDEVEEGRVLVQLAVRGRRREDRQQALGARGGAPRGWRARPPALVSTCSGSGAPAAAASPRPRTVAGCRSFLKPCLQNSTGVHPWRR